MKIQNPLADVKQEQITPTKITTQGYVMHLRTFMLALSLPIFSGHALADSALIDYQAPM